MIEKRLQCIIHGDGKQVFHLYTSTIMNGEKRCNNDASGESINLINSLFQLELKTTYNPLTVTSNLYHSLTVNKRGSLSTGHRAFSTGPQHQVLSYAIFFVPLALPMYTAYYT